MGISLEDAEMADTDGNEELADAVDVDSVPMTLPVPPEYWPADVYEDMDDYERSLPPSQYYRLLRRQIHWAEEEGAGLQRELEDLRATTEDAEGNLVKKGLGDEKGADDNRRAEWQRTEEILDAVLRAETGKVWEMFTGEKPGDGQQNPWELLKALEGATSLPQ
jgi:hypothetical protein